MNSLDRLSGATHSLVFVVCTLSTTLSTMQISEDSLAEFMTIHRTELGKDISRADALEMATRLINLYRLIYRPLPGEAGYDPMPPSVDSRHPRTAAPNAE